jgi:hypothetical protein
VPGEPGQHAHHRDRGVGPQLDLVKEEYQRHRGRCGRQETHHHVWKDSHRRHRDEEPSSQRADVLVGVGAVGDRKHQHRRAGQAERQRELLGEVTAGQPPQRHGPAVEKRAQPQQAARAVEQLGRAQEDQHQPRRDPGAGPHQHPDEPRRGLGAVRRSRAGGLELGFGEQPLVGELPEYAVKRSTQHHHRPQARCRARSHQAVAATSAMTSTPSAKNG